MLDDELPEWLDKTEASLVGVFTTEEGEQFTAEIVEFDEECNEIVVDVIHPGRFDTGEFRGRQSIPVYRIESFDPQARKAQPWPYSDPCRSESFSLSRFSLMTMLLLSMTVGGFCLFLLWADKPYGAQRASAITYTLFEAFATFAPVKGGQRYLFTCPAVQPEIPQLLLRHLGFVVGLFVLQTAILAARPSLPEWWNSRDSKGGTPFELAVLLLCIGLGYVQVYASRSLLARAHRDFSA